jgi:type I restriction enzyme M protein
MSLTLKTLMGDQDHIRENLNEYLRGFSPSVRDLFEYFGFTTQIDRASDQSFQPLLPPL